MSGVGRLRRGEIVVGLVRDGSDISVNTDHPQGGNPISCSPKLWGSGREVSAARFKTLHICDASVFPTAITVNPQLTVMALARYACTHHLG
jgi:choline dehydrogenase-like flavoprotein